MADENAGAPNVFTIANGLTFSRLVLLPVVIVGIAIDNGWLAVVTMVLMWITDLLDGRIARLMRQAGPFGKALDSTVDFVLIYCLFIAFYAAGRLETYQFAFLYLAMISLLSLQFLLMSAGRSDELADTTVGKLTGALQYTYLLFLVALMVIPENDIISYVDMALFMLLAVAIVVNSGLCIARIRSIARGAESA